MTQPTGDQQPEKARLTDKEVADLLADDPRLKGLSDDSRQTRLDVIIQEIRPLLDAATAKCNANEQQRIEALVELAKKISEISIVNDVIGGCLVCGAGTDWETHTNDCDLVAFRAMLGTEVKWD